MNYYLYVETAFHHEGNKEYLLKLVDEAKKAGVNGVKFQVLINLNEFMSSKHSAFEEAKNWVLSNEEWREVFEYTKRLNLDIILMPLDTRAFELVTEFDIKFLEIHSVSFKDKNLLSKLHENTIPLIFGIGGRTLEEIENVVETYKNRKLVLMVGFQSFPSDLEDIKLERIKELQKLFPNCEIGYADHSSYDSEMAIISNEYAYILGARVFEKHIALDEGKDRIDYQSAVSFEKINIIKNKLEYLESVLNVKVKDLFVMSEKEVIYRNRQKVPVANKDILQGNTISKDMLALKMINQDGCISSLEDIVDRITKNNISNDEAFFTEDLT